MYQKIMVPLDGSALAECVFPHVEAIVTACQIPTITFVSVLEPIRHIAYETSFTEEHWKKLEAEGRAYLKKYLAEMAKRLKLTGATVKTEVLSGPVADTLVNYADKNNVDLIIIATHGRSGIRRWVWGSVADRILRHARAPVLMIRAC